MKDQNQITQKDALYVDNALLSTEAYLFFLQCTEGYWSDEKFLNHDGGGGYLDVYICQNALNCKIKIGVFIVCKLYLNKVD